MRMTNTGDISSSDSTSDIRFGILFKSCEFGNAVSCFELWRDLYGSLYLPFSYDAL